MTFFDWIIVWLVGAAIVGVITGRIIRGRGHHHPSPNMRSNKQLTDGRPLDTGEAAAWNLLEQRLRTPDTQARDEEQAT